MENRERVLAIRLRPDESEWVMGEAEKRGISMSAWVRMLMLAERDRMRSASANTNDAAREVA